MSLLFLVFLSLEATMSYGLLDHHGIYRHGQSKVSNMMKTVPKCNHPAPAMLRNSCRLQSPRFFFILRLLPSSIEEQQSSLTLAIQEELVALRKKLSVEFKKPAFVVFTNKAKDAIIAEKPQSAQDIASMSYSGKRISSYAYSEILRITSKFLEGDLQSDDSILRPVEVMTESNGGSGDEIVISPTGTEREQNDESDDSNDSDILLSSLSIEQQRAAERALSGHNLFITGSAGTGKSFLLKYIVQEARKQHHNHHDSVVITAPTGVAAINVGGSTINSFAGYGLGELFMYGIWSLFKLSDDLSDMIFDFAGNVDNEVLKDRVLKQKRAVGRWKKCKVLVIDEVSMLRPEHFELLDEIARHVKKVQSPFGGIQLILSGDFMQLSPVMEKIVKTVVEVGCAPSKYCFQTSAWRKAGLSKPQGGTIQLEEVIRQKGDTDFIGILNEVRRGRISLESLDKLNACTIGRKERPKDGIIPTKLFCYNIDADSENSKKLAELPGPVVSTAAIDTWKVEPNAAAVRKSMIDSISKIASPSIDLKMGAQVMLLRNYIDGSGKAGLVNGSKGVIVRLSGGLPTVLFENGETEIIRPVEYENIDVLNGGHLKRRQIPLKLAW